MRVNSGRAARKQVARPAAATRLEETPRDSGCARPFFHGRKDTGDGSSTRSNLSPPGADTAGRRRSPPEAHAPMLQLAHRIVVAALGSHGHALFRCRAARPVPGRERLGASTAATPTAIVSRASTRSTATTSASSRSHGSITPAKRGPASRAPGKLTFESHAGARLRSALHRDRHEHRHRARSRNGQGALAPRPAHRSHAFVTAKPRRAVSASGKTPLPVGRAPALDVCSPARSTRASSRSMR